jgi:hypothetical protein
MSDRAYRSCDLRYMIAVSCVAFALFIAPNLCAQETAPITHTYRYICIDDAGQNTGSIEMRTTLTRDGDMEIVSTDSAGNREYAKLDAGMIQAGNAFIGDRSLFFILPTLIDIKKIGVEARFVLVRPASGQRATMRLRAEGIVDVPNIGGTQERVYRLRMELADPIGRLF